MYYYYVMWSNGIDINTHLKKIHPQQSSVKSKQTYVFIYIFL
jgi:hypothetical protein